MCGRWLLQLPCFGALLLTAHAEAADAPKQRVALVVDGQCPARENLIAQVEPLLRKYFISPEAPADGDVVARVLDRNAQVQVEVNGTSRAIDDVERNCAERAHVAAVLLALALEPADMGESAQPVAAASPKQLAVPPARPTPNAPEPPSAPAITWSLQALGALGLGSNAEIVGPSWGPLAAIRGSRDGIVAHLAAGYLTPADVPVNAGHVTLARVPIDLSVGYEWTLQSFSLVPMLGVALDPLLLHARETDATETRLDAGPRVTLEASYGGKPWRALTWLRAAWFPRSYDVELEPVGNVGHTPNVWFEAAVGLQYGLF